MLELLRPANIFAPFAITYPVRPLATSIVMMTAGAGGPRCICAGSEEGEAMLLKHCQPTRMTFRANGNQLIYGFFAQDDRGATPILSDDIDSIAAKIKLASVDDFGNKTWADGPWVDEIRPVESVWHDTLRSWYGDDRGVNYVDTLPAILPSSEQTWASLEVAITLREVELPIVQMWEGPIAKRL